MFLSHFRAEYPGYPYVEGLAIDYKEELNLGKLPMIMVFDREGMVFQTDSIEQLESWSDGKPLKFLI